MPRIRRNIYAIFIFRPENEHLGQMLAHNKMNKQFETVEKFISNVPNHSQLMDLIRIQFLEHVRAI